LRFRLRLGLQTVFVLVRLVAALFVTQLQNLVEFRFAKAFLGFGDHIFGGEYVDVGHVFGAAGIIFAKIQVVVEFLFVTNQVIQHDVFVRSIQFVYLVSVQIQNELFLCLI